MAGQVYRNRPQIQRQLGQDRDSDEDVFLPVTSKNVADNFSATWSQSSVSLVDSSRGGFSGNAELARNGPLKQPVTTATATQQNGDKVPSRQISRARSESVQSTSSIVDGLLIEIYDRWHYFPQSGVDSDTFTECSSTSEAFGGRHCDSEFGHQTSSRRLNRAFLGSKGKALLF